MLPYLSLLSIQGLPTPSSLGCYITLNGQLCDILTPLDHCSNTEPVPLPPKGDLALIIRAMGQGAVAWVHISLELIPVDQEVWLPLGREEKPLETLPQAVAMPRLAVTLGQTSRSRLRVCPYIGETYSYETKVHLQTYLVKDLAKEVYALRQQVLTLKHQETAWKQALKSAHNQAKLSLEHCFQRESSLHQALNSLQRELQDAKQTCMILEAGKRELESKLLACEAEEERVKGECILLKGELDRKTVTGSRGTGWMGQAVQEYFTGQGERLETEGEEFRWGQERVEVSFHDGMLVVHDKEGIWPIKEFVKKRKEGKPRELQIAPTFPAIRSLLSPIREQGKCGQGNESPNSTFRTEINEIIQAIEYDPPNPQPPDTGIIAPRLKPLHLQSPLRTKLS